MMIHRSPLFAGALGVVAVLALSSAAMAYTVMPSWDSNSTTYGEAKMRIFGTTPGYHLSLNAGGTTTTFGDQYHWYTTYNVGAELNTFTIVYDAANDTLDMTVNGNELTQVTGVADVSMNYVQMTVSDRYSGSPDQVDMTSLTLNGDDILMNDTTGYQDWHIADNALAGGFTIDGAFKLTERSDDGNDERNKIRFGIGTTTSIAQPIPTPAAAWGGMLLLGLMGGRGILRRRSRR